MGKFIIGTFAILAFAFYELSGGADFVPEERIAQAPAVQPEEPDTQTVAAAPVPDLPEQPTRADTAELTQVAAQPVTASQQEAAALPVATPSTGSTTEVIGIDTQPTFASLSGTGGADLGAINPIREVAARAVNMRSGPSTAFDVIDTLPQGTQAEIMDSDGTGWVRVYIPGTGQTGWMAERLLTAG
ncbi:SH3 domain-containing protein [Loktanella sp. DSM 29012]|uniref:SH3 domain-containing protein n=1 Tax=Loktanella sp. DSM 29012 TaxID=1881056 RepID=UPI0008AF2B6C|nr:SH3 domain-containing protein [Loktanella sp. DSM 29012]SEP70701.1 SH3 domain-containing protein [Loktanella sp. DSM 29012]